MLQLNTQSPFKALNKAYLKEKVSRNNIELFKQQLAQLYSKATAGNSEDTLKDFITEFLRNTWYNPNHIITINKERKDFSIHTGKTAKDPVAVIAEIKKMDSQEMISQSRPNVKALHELVLYYLQERITLGNNEIKYLLATDVNNWILIDANEFDKKIFQHTKIKKLYDVYVNDKKDNPFFYSELKKILDETNDSITCTQFNLNSYKIFVTNNDKTDDEKLIPLYKILSPTHLLKLPFANDSNSLDKNFYTELLHLIGLEEIKDGSKKLIQRKKESSEASLLENAIIKLKDKESLRDVPDVTKFGFTNEEQYYNIALELCITWINRILFLKLLEAQLFSYHQKNNEYLFLNDTFIHDFDELNNLFLQVLAERPVNRRERVKNKFSKVPYLNSSLFERTELERKTIDISALDNNLPLPLDKNTVLKDNSKRKQGSLPTLSYLFTFLNSYDFASEGKAEIQEENKNLINASVLGLIFEKINGYKDGSFFTPGFITMYMCRETLRRAVVQKFNETNKWNCLTFENLQEAIEYADKEKRQQANNIINGLTVCDPAVGSGHFLVSALNELISIKHDLKILQYHHNSQRINHKEYKVDIENDELIIQDIETEDFFKYTLNQKGNIKPELQYLQETLFHEKENLIENCLFGVDINANSVKICRLRLWIELLKNAYYTKESNYTQLETLPNIDINIKQGNSLISRFALDEDLSTTLKKSKWTIDSYKAAVQTYRNAQSKQEKREMEELIETIKKDFRTDVATYDPINKKLSKLRGELALLKRNDLFSVDVKKKTKANKDLENISTAIEKLDKEKDDIQSSVIYNEAFEWRFEFPEVLDSEGKFLGFDVVIGNPPYVNANDLKKIMSDAAYLFLKKNYETAKGTVDLYIYFFEKALKLLKEKGNLSFITPNRYLSASYGEALREYMFSNVVIDSIIDYSDVRVFAEASTYPILTFLSKYKSKQKWDIRIGKYDEQTENLFFKKTTSEKLNIIEGYIWGFLLNEKLPITEKVISQSSKIGNVCKINATSTTSEADDYNKLINQECGYYLINTGTIDRYQSLWGKKYLTDKGKKILTPFLPKNSIIISKNRHSLYSSPKIIIAKISLRTEAFLDEDGNFASINTNCLYDFKKGVDSKYILAWVNSNLFQYCFECFFEGLKMQGGYLLYSAPNLLNLFIKEIDSSYQLPFITLVDKILSAKKENPKANTAALEKEIDELVYTLYGLTKEEIKIVEENKK
jgi:adenine-specific DNA-methyltransferase